MEHTFYCPVIFNRGQVWQEVYDPDQKRPGAVCYATSQTAKRFGLTSVVKIYCDLPNILKHQAS